MTRMNNSAVTCNDFMSFELWSNMVNESIITDSEGSVFQVLEGVVYYMDPMNIFKCNECVCWQQRAFAYSFIGKKLLLASVCKARGIEHAGPREQAEKRGLESSIDINLCRLEKGLDGNKAYAINTQAQWKEERPMFSNRGMVLQGSSYYNTYRSYRHCTMSRSMSFI